MKIIKTSGSRMLSLSTQELTNSEFSFLGNKIALSILKALSSKQLYPKQIAKLLKMHEQKVYYYIHQLEKANIIKVVRQERMQGTFAKYYALNSESFYLRIGDFKESSKLEERNSEFLKPFVEKGKLNALIIVGSPDPHGPLKARSRDGYFGMDLALFLGTFLSDISESKVKLDTEVQDKDLSANNIIILGGPIVNKISETIGKKMPIYFDEDKKGFYSSISKKSYLHEEIGVINKCKNPFNHKKSLLYIAGIRNSGTKASILAFLKRFSEVEKGNLHDPSVHSKVIEGLDLDSDGVVDDVEILE